MKIGADAPAGTLGYVEGGGSCGFSPLSRETELGAAGTQCFKKETRPFSGSWLLAALSIPVLGGG